MLNQNASILFPVLEPSFVVAEHSYLAKLVSFDLLNLFRSFAPSEAEVQRFKEDPDTFDRLMRGALAASLLPLFNWFLDVHQPSGIFAFGMTET